MPSFMHVRVQPQDLALRDGSYGLAERSERLAAELWFTAHAAKLDVPPAMS
jgi:hypothetical protein